MIRYETIAQMFLGVGEQFHKEPRAIYQRKVNGAYQSISYSQLREGVECLYFGLLHLGLEAGDRVGIVSENRVEWVMADFAVVAAGAVDVPVFPTLTDRQIEYTYNNCTASIILVSNRHQLSKLLKIRSELVALEHIIVMNDDCEGDGQSLWRFSDVLELGKKEVSEQERSKLFAEACRKVRPDDLCTIIYTSGTTGHPKGVMLTHKNLCSNINAVNDIVHVGPNDIFLSYLPMCHSYERIGGFYIAFAYGATTAFAESLDTVRTNLKEIRPTIMTSVPRLFERIRDGVIANVEKESPLKQQIFQQALTVGKRYVQQREQGRLSISTRLLYSIADKVVFSKIRELTGGRLRFFVSGGGALSAEVKEFFNLLGLAILEGYGLTESSPVLSVTRLDDDEIGTVGKAINDVELRIADDGEILARGPNIMRGYWKDEAATAEAIDAEGWLHTGDIGIFTDKNNLKITDRKKNIFVSSGGKNIVPLPIENALLASRYVDQILLIGEKREYCTALIVPNQELILGLLRASNKQDRINDIRSINDPEIVSIIMADLQQHQRDLAKYERVRKITLLPEVFSVENGLMTPTLKIKRKEVEKRYAAVIDAMYQ